MCALCKFTKHLNFLPTSLAPLLAWSLDSSPPCGAKKEGSKRAFCGQHILKSDIFVKAVNDIDLEIKDVEKKRQTNAR